MNNQKEIYEALLEGETLCFNFLKVKLGGDGLLTDADNLNYAEEYFTDYEGWKIYKEPKWHENIPEGGVLCWVKDGRNDEPTIARITERGSNNGYYSNSVHWCYATPLRNAEIQTFVDNAPEAS